MSKVELTMENIKKCICSKCPVQEKSECSKEKGQKLMAMMENSDMSGLPPAEAIPGMYCATGKAECGDLDMSQMCICGQCPLWDEYKLMDGKPMGYYCRDGAAE